MFGRRAASATGSAGQKRKWRLDLEEQGSSEEDDQPSTRAAKAPASARREERREEEEEEAPRGRGGSGGRAAPPPSPKAKTKAVEDDGDGGGSGESGGEAAEAAPPQKPPGAKRKKEKAFAWMDSEDDDDGGGGSEDEAEGAGQAGTAARAGTAAEGDHRAGGAAAASQGSQAAATGSTGAGPRSDVAAAKDLLTQLEDVQTFSQFMRLSSDVKSAVPSMAAGHFVTLCQAAARVKYFDGELFDEVFKHLAGKIKGQEFSPVQLTDIVTCLSELNALGDAKLLTAAAASLTPRIGELDKAMRLKWLSLLADMKSPHCEALAAALRTAPVPEEQSLGSMNALGRIACRHYSRGFCSLGKNCTFAHEMGLVPPPSSNPTVLTQMQQTCSAQGGFGLLGGLQAGAAFRSSNAGLPANHAAVQANRPSCRHWVRGFCSMGSGCAFRHEGPAGSAASTPSGPLPVGRVAAQAPRSQVAAPPQSGPRFPMPVKTTSKICIHFSSGGCSWGNKCHFLHVVTPKVGSA